MQLLAGVTPWSWLRTPSRFLCRSLWFRFLAQRTHPPLLDLLCPVLLSCQETCLPTLTRRYSARFLCGARIAFYDVRQTTQHHPCSPPPLTSNPAVVSSFPKPAIKLPSPTDRLKRAHNPIWKSQFPRPLAPLQFGLSIPSRPCYAVVSSHP